MSRKEEEFVRDWLAGSGSREAVEKKIQEAVFVLSPKHAPLPKKNVEHIFSKLRGGALASLPQEDVHEDVELLISGAKVGTLSPKGSISDVLDALNEGPLATKQGATEVKLDNVIPLQRSWSVWGTVVAVAAVLLLLVQPVLNNPTMMTSYQEADRAEAPKDVARRASAEQEDEDDLVEETKPMVAKKEETDELVKAPAPVVAKKEAPRTKAKTSVSSRRKTVPKRSKTKQKDDMVSEKKRRQEESVLDVMEDAEIIALEEAKAFEQERESERALITEEEMFAEEREPAPAPEASTTVQATRVESTTTLETDILSVLRAEALQGTSIPRHPPFAQLDREALISVTQQANVQELYWAAYELAIRFPQERNHIESLLRLRTAPSLAQRYLLILLGDIYRSEGNLQRAQTSYRKALQIR